MKLRAYCTKCQQDKTWQEPYIDWAKAAIELENKYTPGKYINIRKERSNGANITR